MVKLIELRGESACVETRSSGLAEIAVQKVVQQAPEKHEETGERGLIFYKNQQCTAGPMNVQTEGFANYERRVRSASEYPESWIDAKWWRDCL